MTAATRPVREPCGPCRGTGRRIHGWAVCPGPCADCGGTGTASTDLLTVTRFDHSNGDAHMTGMRGTRVAAETRFTSSRVFSEAFPTVYVTDNGEVEMDDLVVPAVDAAAWFRAVADHIEARLDAS